MAAPNGPVRKDASGQNSGKGRWAVILRKEPQEDGGRGAHGVGGTCFPSPWSPQGPGLTPHWTPGPTPGRRAAAAVRAGRRQQSLKEEPRGSLCWTPGLHTEPESTDLQGSAGTGASAAPWGAPAPAWVGALRSAAGSAPGTVLPPPLLVAEWSVRDAPDGPADRLLSSAMTLPPSTTWRPSPDVGGLRVRTRRCPVCVSPLPACLRVSRGGQSRRRRASRRVRSLFRGIWSRASSPGKLDPGPYRRVSEPRARWVAPAASLSGWRRRRCPRGGALGPAPAALGSGSGCGQCWARRWQSPVRGGSPRPWLGRQALGALGALLQVRASAPGSSMLSTPRSRRCGRPPPQTHEALAPGQPLERSVRPFACMFRFSHLPQVSSSGKRGLNDAVSG